MVAVGGLAALSESRRSHRLACDKWPMNPYFGKCRGTARRQKVSSGLSRSTFYPCHVPPSLCKRGPGEVGTSCGAQLALLIGEHVGASQVLWRELPLSSAEGSLFPFFFFGAATRRPINKGITGK